MASAPSWHFQPCLDWLISQGRRLNRPELLTAELATMLRQHGLPLLRMRLSLRTLNPLAVGRAYTWWNGQPDVEVFSPPHSILQSPDYLGSPIEQIQLAGRPFRCRLAKVSHPQQLHDSLQVLRTQGATDYLALPLQFTHDRTPSPWILVSDHPDGFSPEQVAGLTQLAEFLAPIVEVQALQLTTLSLLNTYVGPRTARKLIAGQVQRGDGEEIDAVIWYCDLRNSTAITEMLPAPQLLRLLNRYFELIHQAVTGAGGEVLRFIGDAMLVLFPSDTERSLRAAARAALCAARQAHQAIQAASEELQAEGLPPLRYGLGLDVGRVLYGNVGAPERLDFTILGAAVNRAARIETLTKALEEPLLVSEPLARLLPDDFERLGAYPAAGLAEPLPVYRLRNTGEASRADDQTY